MCSIGGGGLFSSGIYVYKNICFTCSDAFRQWVSISTEISLLNVRNVGAPWRRQPRSHFVSVSDYWDCWWALRLPLRCVCDLIQSSSKLFQPFGTIFILLSLSFCFNVINKSWTLPSYPWQCQSLWYLFYSCVLNYAKTVLKLKWYYGESFRIWLGLGITQSRFFTSLR